MGGIVGGAMAAQTNDQAAALSGEKQRLAYEMIQNLQKLRILMILSIHGSFD